MALDLIIRNARLASAGPDTPPVDIGVRAGTIVAVEPNLAADGPAHDVGGKLVSPGLIESHFHLDKAMTIDRLAITVLLGFFRHLSTAGIGLVKQVGCMTCHAPVQISSCQ
jgi:cytosine/adenosine deaminase-related metal-dependent hydrolase